MKKSRYRKAKAGKDGYAGSRGDVPNGRVGADVLSLRKVYCGLGAGELRRKQQLEDKNRKLKQLEANHFDPTSVVRRR